MALSLIVVALWSGWTPAQSGGSASVSPSGGVIQNAQETITRAQSVINRATGATTRREVADPLQQADRTHTETTRRLVAKFQASTDAAERRSVREELQKVIGDHFAVRQQIRAKELAELQAQVRRLQELHDRRELEKDQIIADRMGQLLRDAEGLGWGGGDSPYENKYGSRYSRPF
jgi:hypothetical protein